MINSRKDGDDELVDESYSFQAERKKEEAKRVLPIIST